MLTNEEWSGFRNNIKALFQIKAFKDFWEKEEAVFSELFRKEVNKMISELPYKKMFEDSIITPKDS